MPALGGSQPVSFQFLDYSGERKSVTVYANEITAISLPGLLTQISALETALEAVTLGTLSQTSFGNREVLSNTRPTEKDAQIETEMLVYMRGDTTEKPYSFRIPTVDYTAFNYADPPAGDSVIISGSGASAATTALVTALEAFSAPDDETEGWTVVGMKVVR